MSDAEAVAARILKNAMGLKQGESLLIVTDRQLCTLAGAFFSAGQKLTKKARLVTIDIPQSHGEEPHPDIARMMAKHDVCMLITTKSLTHTKARMKASKAGARIASMPGLRESMFSTALAASPKQIGALNGRLIRILGGKKDIRITTGKGTDVTFSIRGRKWVSNHGTLTKKGAVGNLPAGEVFIAPLEGRTEGRLVVDESIATAGKVKKPIIISIKRGRIVSVAGGKEALVFGVALVTDRHRMVAELGIGTNRKARITGAILEDEKMFGTFHVAFGNNRQFGGTIDVPFHVDAVAARPTIMADGKAIMREGKLLQ